MGRLRRIPTLAVAAVLTLGVTGGVVAAGADSPRPAPYPFGVSALTIALTTDHVTVTGNAVAGAVNVTATTTGKPDGALVVVRLQPGVTATRLFSFIQTHPNADPNALADLAPTVLSFPVPPGTTRLATSLGAADYLAFDSAYAGTMDEWPHATFHVATTSQPAALPTPAATVRAIDFTFATPANLTQGSLVQFENDGYVQLQIVGVMFDNDQDARTVVNALRVGDTAPVVEYGNGSYIFSGPVDHGAVVQRRLTAPKGVMVLMNTLSTQDGRIYTQIGMVRIIHIV